MTSFLHSYFELFTPPFKHWGATNKIITFWATIKLKIMYNALNAPLFGLGKYIETLVVFVIPVQNPLNCHIY